MVVDPVTAPVDAVPVPVTAAGSRVAIGRIREATSRWRVVVETWPDGAEHFRGRLVFHPEEPSDRSSRREGPPALHGHSPEDVVRAAFELPEAELRTLLRSLA